MRNEIPNRRKTSRPNTDTRPNSRGFYDPGLNRQIANREPGVEAFNDFMDHLSQVGELKHEEGMGEAITELE